MRELVWGPRIRYVGTYAERGQGELASTLTVPWWILRALQLDRRYPTYFTVTCEVIKWRPPHIQPNCSFFLERNLSCLTRVAANIKVRACLIFTPQLKLCEVSEAFRLIPLDKSAGKIILCLWIWLYVLAWFPTILWIVHWIAGYYFFKKNGFLYILIYLHWCGGHRGLFYAIGLKRLFLSVFI
jgi:hypothetical protein